MGAGPSKGGPSMGGGLGFLAAAQAAARATADPEEMRRDPQRAIARHMLMGTDPVEMMMNMARTASKSNQQRTSGSAGQGGNSTSGQSNSGTNQDGNRSNQSPAPGRRTRRRSTHEPDPSSETNSDPDGISQWCSPIMFLLCRSFAERITASRSLRPAGRSMSTTGISEVSYHFVRRLTRFVRLNGIGQYIAEQTDITRSLIFRAGPSQFQDRSSGVAEHHAAHVVRVQINERIERDFPEFFELLTTFVGHTHIVPRYANVWYGTGGEIDRVQARFLSELSAIDLRGPLTARVEDILSRFRQAFIDVFESAIESGRLSDGQVLVMQDIIEEISGITLRELFEKGREGLTYLQINM